MPGGGAQLQGVGGYSGSGAPAGAPSGGNYGYPQSYAAPAVSQPPTISPADYQKQFDMTVPPVLSQSDVQQQINAQQAANQRTGATQQRQAMQGLAGQGYASSSPLAQAIRAQIGASVLGSNAQAATQTRLNAAQMNAANQAQQLAAIRQQIASMYGSQLGAQSSIYGSQASMYGSQQAANASMYGSQLGAQASMYGSQQAANASQYGSRLQQLASQYGADQSLKGQLGAANIGAQAAITSAIISALSGLMVG